MWSDFISISALVIPGVGLWVFIFSAALSLRRKSKRTLQIRTDRYGRKYELDVTNINPARIVNEMLSDHSAVGSDRSADIEVTTEDITKVKAAVPRHYACDIAQVSSAAMVPPGKTRKALLILAQRGEIERLERGHAADRFTLSRGGGSNQ